MNETTYNLAMFGKEYLDKALIAIKDIAPDVWWYLEWKCHIISIEWIAALLVTIIVATVTYKISIGWVKKENKDDDDNTIGLDDMSETRQGVSAILAFILFFLVVTLIATFGIFVVSLTPICPIDQAIAIGKGLIG